MNFFNGDNFKLTCDIFRDIFDILFVLSRDNPFYAEGKVAKGLGSPHTPKEYVWHMGLCMQGMTADSKEEALMILDMLLASDAGTGFMHEGFHADNPDEFT
ncbi:MAG: glycoside hydrolase family 125 protein, partial [Clostridia bacterium]|nr:glycoside hydrolase family 125 protein [Clostridia bacterium]